VNLADLNALAESEALEKFRACCGSSRWAGKMTQLRPFHSREELLAAADEVWNSLGPDDWREAFAHHPRIGDRATGTAATEQSGIRSAADDVRAELAKANREYEERFGYIYIVCATGRTADEMLDIVKQRLNNDPDTELKVAAEEQRKITQIRLKTQVEE
jgi:2-oxo-4-hydroxy-4-carboxy-5-ureidoimidazoline decarboxylase